MHHADQGGVQQTDEIGIRVRALGDPQRGNSTTTHFGGAGEIAQEVQP